MALAGDGKAGIILRINTSGSSPPPSTRTESDYAKDYQKGIGPMKIAPVQG